MGIIGQTPLSELAACERARAFLQQGNQKPDDCASCHWYKLCFGGCKRD